MSGLGYTGSTRPDPGVRSLIYERSESDNRVPTSMAVANTGDSTVAVTLEWERYDRGTYTISDGYQIDPTRTKLADLLTFPMRKKDKLWVTVSAEATVFLFFDEPPSGNAQ